MSESIRRKNSSRQLLQNLIRVTAQRSQEDAEELERERRRRSREKERGEGSLSWPEPPQHNDFAHNTELDEALKPSCCLVLEEDEGFSDWSHRLENRNEQEAPEDFRARLQRPSTPPRWKPEEGKQQEEEEEERCEPERSRRSQKASTRPPEKISSNRKEVKTSYSSSVFLPQESRLLHAAGQPPDRTSYLVAGTMKPRGGACRVDGEVEKRERKEEEEVRAVLQTQWRSTETQQSLRDEDDEEEEELRFIHEDKEDLHHVRREEGHWEEEEEDEEEEEELKMSDKRLMESRRSEGVYRRGEEANGRSKEANWRREEVSRRSEEANWRREEVSRRSEEANWRSEDVNRKSEELNRRSEEANRRSEEPNWRREEVNRWSGGVYRRGEEANRRSEEANWRSEEPNRRSEEPNRRSEEPNWRSEEPNWRSEDINRRSEEANRKSEVANWRSEEPNWRSEEPNWRSEDINRSEELNRRSEEVNRRSTASRCSSSDGEESLHCYGPMSPTFKKLLIQFYPDEANSRVSTDGKCTIIERTESLRKSTNNIKKTLPPVPVSKIDKKLEQYTHALEVSSKEGRSGGQVPTDLTSPTEPVSSKKNLFESWNQNTVTYAPSKDADGLKVGVANLINQWVKGSEDGSRCSSPFKPADSSGGKRYKFVVTGHGKYEKVSVDDGCSEDANCQSAGQLYEDL